MKPFDTAGENPTQPAGGGGRAPGAARTPPLEISAGDNATFAVTPDSAVEFKAGVVVGDQFEVVRLLGRGGMGAVYEVRDQLSGQKLALKTILPSILAKPNAASRFVQEVTTARQLRHPGIVAVYDLRKSGPLLFFTMELLEGRTLRAELAERGRLPLDETARILAELCDALAYAHQYTIHRDLSPENVMILPGGRLKLLDFGIAKTLDPSSFTSSNMAMGKAYYMAPEQRRDASRVDARADIWSLGVLFFEMLSGEMPVGYGKLTDLVPELPADCEGVVERSITPPDNRFESVEQFLDALQYCVPHLVLRRGHSGAAHAFPRRDDVPETLVEMAREFVARQKGEWSEDQFKDFCLSVYENPGHVGISRETIARVIESEQRDWLDREARRKAEEARRAEERQRAAEEAERRRKEAEEARRRQELHEKTRALRAEARAALEKGEYEKAVQAWEGVLKNLPDDDEAGQQVEIAKRALSKAEAERKTEEKKRRQEEEARRRQELNEKTRALRAEAQAALEKGEYEKSTQAWEGVLKIAPDDNEARKHIEIARRALRKAEEERKAEEKKRRQEAEDRRRREEAKRRAEAQRELEEAKKRQAQELRDKKALDCRDSLLSEPRFWPNEENCEKALKLCTKLLMEEPQNCLAKEGYELAQLHLARSRGTAALGCFMPTGLFLTFFVMTFYMDGRHSATELMIGILAAAIFVVFFGVHNEVIRENLQMLAGVSIPFIVFAIFIIIPDVKRYGLIVFVIYIFVQVSWNLFGFFLGAYFSYPYTKMPLKD